MTRRIGWIALALAASCQQGPSPPSPTAPPRAVAAADSPTAAPAAPPTAPAPAASPTATPPAPPPPQLPPKVRITVRTSPARKAKVYWGRKLLGMTPLQIERPRRSGPIDLVLRADGYLPVHVRVYTDNDDGLTVELTRPADRMRLFGAKQELPPPDAVPASPLTPSPGAVPDARPTPAAPAVPTPAAGRAVPSPAATTPTVN